MTTTDDPLATPSATPVPQMLAAYPGNRSVRQPTTAVATLGMPGTSCPMTTTDPGIPTDTVTSVPGTTITVIWPGGTYPVGDDPGGNQGGGHNGGGGHH